MKIYDITKTLNEDIAVWPGDQKFQRESESFELQGNIWHASRLSMSLHTGTHLDAHYHYDEKGKTIDQHDLSRYVGKCQVIDVSQRRDKTISLNEISCEIVAKRVLFKTSRSVDAKIWEDDFRGFSPELIHFLHEKKVELIGIDSFSVDPYGEEMPVHLLLGPYDIYNIEGLNLNEVEEGLYTLMALPLKLEGADGSPVRAILIEGDLES
ncbi:MAG: cyclase family protein [Clostridia bacterium]|nr:cyclase family protein [Clostridia bacterium]